MLNLKLSWWGLYLLTAFIFGSIKIDVGSGDVFVIDIFSAMTFFYLITHIPSKVKTKAILFISVYCFLCLLITIHSSILHGVQLSAVVGMVRYFEYLIWGIAFFLRYRSVDAEGEGGGPLEIKLIYIFILSVSILQFLGVKIFLESWQEYSYKYGSGFRVPGVFLHPNINSFFLSFFPILYFYRGRAVLRIQMLVAFMILLSFILTNSRGNIAIAGIGFVLLYVRGLKMMLLATVAILAAVVVSSIVDYTNLADWLRLDSKSSLSDNSSFTLRLALWNSALALFYHSPLLGHGFKQFPFLTDIYIWGDTGNGVEAFKTHANSFILGSLAETGAVFVLLILHKVKRILVEYGNAFFVLFIFILLYDDLFHDPYSMALLLFMMISLTGTRYSNDEKN